MIDLKLDYSSNTCKHLRRTRILARLACFIVLVLIVLLGPLPAQAMPDAQSPTPTPSIVLQSDDAYIAYTSSTRTWEIGTNAIRRRMRYDTTNGLRPISLYNKYTSREWLAQSNTANTEFRLELDGTTLVSTAPNLVFQGYKTTKLSDGSIQLQISLARAPLVIHLFYQVFPGTSVLEQWVGVQNTGATPIPKLTALDTFALGLRPTTDDITLYWVRGVSAENNPTNPATLIPALQFSSNKLTNGVQQTIGSRRRSSEDDMGWFTLWGPTLRGGLFGGIEWSGAWKLNFSRSDGTIWLTGGLAEFSHTLGIGETFLSPRRFVGFYKTDLDNATNASHNFARQYLLRPRPSNFPWTQFNTWFTYYTDLNEDILKREVDIAAELGLEVFYVDAGWYEGSPSRADFSFGLGSWRENRAKFPSGLAAFSKYVHSKGLKFGLWVEPERVDLDYVGPDTGIQKEWLSPWSDFDNARATDLPRMGQICLGHAEARAWMKDMLARLVRDYQLDWLKWDNNVWFPCNPPDELGDGDYKHILGLYEVLDDLRQEFPNLIIENCASGGNRMDYALMRRTDIAWLSDQTDPSYRVRYHVAGASYPFPPEYLNSWFVESWFEHMELGERHPSELRAWLRSRMMGAFGISESMLDWSPSVRAIVAQEIRNYKSVRNLIAQGNMYRLLPQNGLEENLEPPTEPDATEFYDPITDTATFFFFEGRKSWTTKRFILKGLDPATSYQISSADQNMPIMQRTGQQLMTQGLSFNYAPARPSIWLFIKPINPRN
jgi:alpha-galactosidase